MKIAIETIPHNQQRYDTVGDYWIDEDGTVQVRVSEMRDSTYEQAAILHELFELFLVQNRNISIDAIDEFDKSFEANRAEGNIDEPGDDINAPYRDEHCFATAVERMFIAANGKSWKEYDEAVLSCE